MSDYQIRIDGNTWKPIPQAWVEHADAEDAGSGSPRLYAVSARPRGYHQISIRYGELAELQAVEINVAARRRLSGPYPDGLADGSGWTRSLVPIEVEPAEPLRLEEEQHLRELLEGQGGEPRVAVADGGGQHG